MDIQKLQLGLLDWFWLDPNELKTYSSIENICVKLFEQYFPDQDVLNAKYQIFYPLIKYGVLEFYGNKKFGLSPTTALFTDTHILLLNTTQNIEISQGDYFNSNLGACVLTNSPEIQDDLKKLTIPSSRFILADCLYKISSLENIVYSWIEDKIIDSNNLFLFDENYKWVNYRSLYINGIYKKSSEVYAERILKITDNSWKIIPSRDYNLDAFNIAVIWSQIQNDWDIGIEYCEKENTLTINNLFFPILIERLLFINTLLESSDRIDVFKRQYFIKKTDFYILNKLLKQKIKIK